MRERFEIKPNGGIDRVKTVILELVSVIALIMAIFRVVTVELSHFIK